MDKIKGWKKLKMWQNWKCDKLKMWRIENVTKLKMWHRNRIYPEKKDKDGIKKRKISEREEGESRKMGESRIGEKGEKQGKKGEKAGEKAGEKRGKLRTGKIREKDFNAI